MKRYPEDMQGRTVIVTGAGNGLGLGIGRRFAAGGARVLLVDQDPVVLTRVEEKTMFAMINRNSSVCLDRLVNRSFQFPILLRGQPQVNTAASIPYRTL
jgi:short-subunit dehydrogenase involved in D-alanine esterification of teichoic acids